MWLYFITHFCIRSISLFIVQQCIIFSLFDMWKYEIYNEIFTLNSWYYLWYLYELTNLEISCTKLVRQENSIYSLQSQSESVRLLPFCFIFTELNCVLALKCPLRKLRDWKWSLTSGPPRPSGCKQWSKANSNHGDTHYLLADGCSLSLHNVIIVLLLLLPSHGTGHHSWSDPLSGVESFCRYIEILFSVFIDRYSKPNLYSF